MQQSTTNLDQACWGFLTSASCRCIAFSRSVARPNASEDIPMELPPSASFLGHQVHDIRQREHRQDIHHVTDEPALSSQHTPSSTSQALQFRTKTAQDEISSSSPDDKSGTLPSSASRAAPYAIHALSILEPRETSICHERHTVAPGLSNRMHAASLRRTS